MPAMTRSRVDLPEPLWPTRANIEPDGTASDTSLSAQNSFLRSNRSLVTFSFRLAGRSCCSRKRLKTLSTTTAGGASRHSSSTTERALRLKIAQPASTTTTDRTVRYTTVPSGGQPAEVEEVARHVDELRHRVELEDASQRDAVHLLGHQSSRV